MREPKAVIIIFFMLMLAVIIQSTFLFLTIWNVRPDFCLIIVVFVALQRGPMAGMLSGFTAGLFEGFFTLPYGFHALIKTILGYILGRFEGTLSLDSIVMRLLLVAGATIAKGFISGFSHLLFGIPGQPFFIFIGETLLETLYNALFCLPLLFLLSKMRLFKTKVVESL